METTISQMTYFQILSLLMRTLREQFPAENLAADRAAPDDRPTSARPTRAAPQRGRRLSAGPSEQAAAPAPPRVAVAAARTQDIARVIEVQQGQGGEAPTPAPGVLRLPEHFLALLNVSVRADYDAELARVRRSSTAPQRRAFDAHWSRRIVVASAKAIAHEEGVAACYETHMAKLEAALADL